MGALETVQGVIVTGAAVAGAYAALSGVSAWRRQLTGKTEYDVGLTVLRATYKVRESIAVARQPFISAEEMSAALKETRPDGEGGVSDDWNEKVNQGTAATYQVRWRVVSDAVQDLDVARIEAEVVWGSAAAEPIFSLRKCVAKLNWALTDYLRELSDPTGMAATERKGLRAIMYAVGADGDTFGGEIDAAVTTIEQFVRPKLGRKLRQPNKGIEQNAKR